MFGDGPQPLTESKQKPKKEKVQGETQPVVRGDKELPPNVMEKHPVQVRKIQIKNTFFINLIFSC